MSFYKLLGKIFIIAGFSLFANSSTAFADVAYITDNSVNVRSENSTSSLVIDQFNKGQEVSLIGYDGEWAKIKHPSGNEAFVFGQYVMIDATMGKVSVDRLNIRENPTVDSNILGQLHSGDTVSIVGMGTNWYVVDYNGSLAYVYADYVIGDYIDIVKKVSLIETPVQKSYESSYAQVTASNGLRLREGPSTDTNILYTMPYNDVMDIMSISGEWAKVSVDDLVGYVRSEFIEVKTGTKPTRTGYSSKALELIAYAKECLGNRYVWGGTSLTKGADCSGFVYSLMKKVGVTVGRTSRDQARNGYAINKSELKPGDLVFFGTKSYISHVGIYIGGGQFIHSSSERVGVIISNLSARKDYVTARRVL